MIPLAELLVEQSRRKAPALLKLTAMPPGEGIALPRQYDEGGVR